MSLVEELTRGLEATLLATDADGARRYSDAVVRDALPLLVLGLGDALRPDALSPTLRRVVLDYMTRAGAAEAVDEADAAERLARHAADNPLPEDLVRALDALVRDGLESLDDAERAAARAELARLTGRPAS